MSGTRYIFLLLLLAAAVAAAAAVKNLIQQHSSSHRRFIHQEDKRDERMRMEDSHAGAFYSSTRLDSIYFQFQLFTI